MKESKGTITSTYTRQGDYNKNVLVRGITMDNGTSYEATIHLDNKYENYSTPFASIKNLEVNDRIVVLHGSVNNGAHPTFIGVK